MLVFAIFTWLGQDITTTSLIFFHQLLHLSPSSLSTAYSFNNSGFLTLYCISGVILLTMLQSLLALSALLLSATYAAPAPAAGFLSGAAAVEEVTPVTERLLRDFIAPPSKQFLDDNGPIPDIGDVKVGDVIRNEVPVSAT